jgi:adenylate kinase family enzyme
MGMQPPAVLIDCSELELGRNLGQRHGRPDDSLDAYKRRLKLYRELTLPMLKTIDEQNRLRIVSLLSTI